MATLRTATLVHEGGMRFVATTGSGRSLIWGDDAAQGELSPVESVVVALAACSAMDVIGIALKKRQVIERYEIRVRADQRLEYPQILTRVDVTHDIAGPQVDEASIRRCVELSATKYCPVSAMLSAGATEIHHRYVVRNTGDAPFTAEAEVVVTGPYKRPEIVP